MKYILFMLVITCAVFSYGQPEFYMESYPTKQELLKLNSIKTYERLSKEYIDEENMKCEGRLKFFRSGRDIDIRPVGEWKHYYPSGQQREVALYDEKGHIKELFEFDEKGAFLSDSRYEYKKHGGITYRIERYSAYNAKGTIVRQEFWFSKITTKSAFMVVSIPKKIGFWKEYDEAGTAVVETKAYKPKLASNLGLHVQGI